MYYILPVDNSDIFWGGIKGYFVLKVLLFEGNPFMKRTKLNFYLYMEFRVFGNDLKG